MKLQTNYGLLYTIKRQVYCNGIKSRRAQGSEERLAIAFLAFGFVRIIGLVFWLDMYLHSAYIS